MNFYSKIRVFLFSAATKTIWLVAGLLFVIVGQALIREPQALTSFKTITELTNNWNKAFHLDLKNPANILVGLFLIALALIIYNGLFASSSGSNKQESSISSGERDLLSWKKHLLWLIASLSIYAVVMLLLAYHQYSPLFLGIWLVCIMSFTYAFWKNENQNMFKAGNLLTYVDGAWMLTLFAFAIATGSYLLNDLPAGWIPDEGPFWTMGRDIALGEITPPFFDFGVFSFPVASSILQGQIMRWAGVNMWGWRFASVLPAALTVFPLYLLGCELFDRRVAIAANVIMIVNPYFLAFSRLGYNNIQSLLPVTLSIYFLVVGIRKNSYFYFWLAGLAAGFGFYTYFAAWLGLVVLITTLIFFPLIHGAISRKSLITLGIVLAGTFSVFLPRALYNLSSDTPGLLHLKIWESALINTFYGNHVFGAERMAQARVFMMNDQVGIFYDPSLYGILIWRGIIRSSAVLFDPIGYSDHSIFLGLAGPVSSGFFVLGLGIALANFKKIQYFIPTTWFLIGFFFLGVLTSLPPRPTHMVAIIPAMAFVSAIGLTSVVDAVTKATEQVQREKILLWRKVATASALAIIAILGLFQFFFMLPYAYFPPHADDYISWLGRQISQPANIYLVDHYSTLRNPASEGLLKLSLHSVSFLKRSELDSHPDQLKTWDNFVAFVGPQTGKDYAEWIARNIPDSHLQPAYVPGKRLRGYIITDLQVNTTLDISLFNGLKSVWNSPARAILAFCGLGIMLLFVLNKKK